MGKSQRSKVKRAYRGLRRQVMDPLLTQRQNETITSLHITAGLPPPQINVTETQLTKKKIQHGGMVLHTSFIPNPKGPTLNRVHTKRGIVENDNDGNPLFVMDLIPNNSDAKTNSFENINEDDVENDDEIMEIDRSLSKSGKSINKKRRKVGKKLKKPKSKKHPQNKRYVKA